MDIEHKEITEPLIAEYNLKVKNLLFGIQADYRFRLQCHDFSYDDVAVWTDMLKIPVRSLTPLAHQSSHTVNPSSNFQSHATTISFLDSSSTPDREAREEIHWLEEVANQWNRRSQHHQVPQCIPAACGTPQFSPIPGRPLCGYARCNHNDRRYPNNRHNCRPEVSQKKGESMATMAMAKALNKLTENLPGCRVNP